ncbi:hypothetical protein PMIN03_010201 [Paraphaeosphaeria minitans]
MLLLQHVAVTNVLSVLHIWAFTSLIAPPTHFEYRKNLDLTLSLCVKQKSTKFLEGGSLLDNSSCGSPTSEISYSLVSFQGQMKENPLPMAICMDVLFCGTLCLSHF